MDDTDRGHYAGIRETTRLPQCQWNKFCRKYFHNNTKQEETVAQMQVALF